MSIKYRSLCQKDVIHCAIFSTMQLSTHKNTAKLILYLSNNVWVYGKLHFYPFYNKRYLSKSETTSLLIYPSHPIPIFFIRPQSNYLPASSFSIVLLPFSFGHSFPIKSKMRSSPLRTFHRISSEFVQSIVNQWVEVGGGKAPSLGSILIHLVHHQ